MCETVVVVLEDGSCADCCAVEELEMWVDNFWVDNFCWIVGAGR